MSDVYEMFNNLPTGWSTADLGDLLERITNGMNANQSKVPVGIPISRIETISQGVVNFERVQYVTDVDEKKFEHFSLKKGDILFSHINSDLHLGKTAVFQSDKTLLHGINLLLLRTKSNLLNPKYLHYILNLYRASGLFMAIAQHAVNQSSLNQTKIKSIKVPLPPTVEDQERIVAEIEKQFSRLDEAVASLKRIQANLKRYKAAVLKVAVEGKLTEQWRKDHPDVKPADQLLKRILAERRAKWESEELAKMKAKGIKPKDDSWKKKYKEPAGPDMANLPELPEGWVWASLDQLSCDSLIGLDRGRDQQNSLKVGVPYVKMNNITMGGHVVFEDMVFVHASEVEQERYKLKDSDLLFNTRNSKELVGKVGLVRTLMISSIYNNNLMRIRFCYGISPAFICFQMCSDNFRKRLELVKKATTNVAAIYGKDLFPLQLALPPLVEQHQIVSEIDRRLSVTEELETTIETNLKRAERLRQTILLNAFNRRNHV